MSDAVTTIAAVRSQSLNQLRGEQAVSQLRNSVKDDPKRIAKAARDFESILVGQWLEQAEKSFATIPGGNPDDENVAGHDELMSVAVQSLSEGLSRAGGLGLSKLIAKGLTGLAESRLQASGAEVAPQQGQP